MLLSRLQQAPTSSISWNHLRILVGFLVGIAIGSQITLLKDPTILIAENNYPSSPCFADDVDEDFRKNDTVRLRSVNSIEELSQDHIRDDVEQTSPPTTPSVQPETIALVEQGTGDVATSIAQLPASALSGENRFEVCCTQTDRYWMKLCRDWELLKAIDERLVAGEDVLLLQIGAHMGWNANDPISKGLTCYMEKLTPSEKTKLHFKLVEASPPTFRKLENNVKKYSHLCHMSALHMGILPDDNANDTNKTPMDNGSALTFYSINDSVDRETGFDSISGKRLPFWASQIASFSKETVMKEMHAKYFRQLGLKIEDYIVEEKIPTISFSQLVAEDKPLLVLLDTEGLDCKILMNLRGDVEASSSKHIVQKAEKAQELPPFIIFEHKHCGVYDRDTRALKQTEEHLTSLGYAVDDLGVENKAARLYLDGTFVNDVGVENKGTTLDSNRAESCCIELGAGWAVFCREWGLLKSMDERLRKGDDVSILQIGAHIGWNPNDPMSKGLTCYMEKLSPAEKQNLHYQLVEASPPTFARLQENINEFSHLCNISALHLGVVPYDDSNSTGNLTFFSIKDTVDRKTGVDSSSGKQLPFWVSQISSFSKSTLMKHSPMFAQQGLRLSDYIIAESIPTSTLSQLSSTRKPLMVILDTEGLDCDILSSFRNTHLPQYLLYEHKHCGRKGDGKVRATKDHLGSLGYSIRVLGRENTAAFRP